MRSIAVKILSIQLFFQYRLWHRHGRLALRHGRPVEQRAVSHLSAADFGASTSVEHASTRAELGTIYPGGSRTPWGIHPAASTSRPSKAQLSWPRRQVVRGICRHTRVPAPLRPPGLTALLPSCQRCCRATSHPSKSRRPSLRWHPRLRLAADASATLLPELKVLAWYFLSPDMFRSEATDTRMGSGSAVELKTERFAMTYRLVTPLFVWSLSKIAHSHSGRVFTWPAT